MHVLRARNVHQMLPEAMRLFKMDGVERNSRNGPVLTIPEPVALVYERPTERVMFWRDRDANPFFHVLEALWMLAGRDDVAFISKILPGMKQFSDDGVVFHGAYGRRWRRWFMTDTANVFGEIDQLQIIAGILKKNPDCRRQVLQIWDAEYDLGEDSKDLPCNTQAYFSRDTKGRLNMMVTNRSNDVIWGALGANAVHFSFLQEYVAAMIGCEVGKYWQVTNNLHLYLKRHEALMDIMVDKSFPSGQYKTDPYEEGLVEPTPLIYDNVKQFDTDSLTLINDKAFPLLGARDKFVRNTAWPLMQALFAYRDENHAKPLRVSIAQNILNTMPEKSDWRLAAQEWLQRRNKK